MNTLWTLDIYVAVRSFLSRLATPDVARMTSRGTISCLTPARDWPRLPQVMIGMMSSATMFATLIIGLIAGPAVSL